MHIPDGFISPQTYLPAYAVAAGLWFFSTPHFCNVISFKGEIEFFFMFCNKPRKGNGQVKTKCHITTAIVLKTEHLFFSFSVTLSQQYLGIFEGRCVYWYKTERAKCRG